MELREIFDKVKHHMLTQNQQSLDTYNNCVYRGVDGLMCAVGCLIPDEYYTEGLEGGGVKTPEVQAVLIDCGIIKSETEEEKIELLFQLQYLHDMFEPIGWPSGLDKLENKFFGV